MYGPHGCGKTFIVKASAGECDAGFVNAKLSDLLDMYVGNTEKNIHKVFELSRKNTPCILFFDEVDAIGGRRDQSQGAQYLKMAVNQMLYEMSGIESHNENVLVVAATNAPWDVDPALRRSGRFSKTIYVPAPDFTSRIAILKIHGKKRPLSRWIPYRRLALATMGYSAADLKAIVEEAASYPWKEAFKAIEKKKEKYVAQGMNDDDAKAKAEAKERMTLEKKAEEAEKLKQKKEEAERIKREEAELARQKADARAAAEAEEERLVQVDAEAEAQAQAEIAAARDQMMAKIAELDAKAAQQTANQSGRRNGKPDRVIAPTDAGCPGLCRRLGDPGRSLCTARLCRRLDSGRVDGQVNCCWSTGRRAGAR